MNTRDEPTQPNVEQLDEAIAQKLRAADAAGTTPDFTIEESARYRVLLQDALAPDTKTSSEAPVSVALPGDATLPERTPAGIGTVLRLRDILGTESFDEFRERARCEQERINKDK